MKRQPSLWGWIHMALLLALCILVAILARDLCATRPETVSEAKMAAEWLELQRMADKHPYTEGDHGCR